MHPDFLQENCQIGAKFRACTESGAALLLFPAGYALAPLSRVVGGGTSLSLKCAFLKHRLCRLATIVHMGGKASTASGKSPLAKNGCLVNQNEIREPFMGSPENRTHCRLRRERNVSTPVNGMFPAWKTPGKDMQVAWQAGHRVSSEKTDDGP